MVDATDPRLLQCGFAKLTGDGVDYVFRKYDICIGRENGKVELDVSIGGNQMNISRKHARIAYNFVEKQFELIVEGKNGVTVGSELLTPDSAPYKLSSGDLLKIGDSSLYFLLPKDPTRIFSQHRAPAAVTPASIDGAQIGFVNKVMTTGMGHQMPPMGMQPPPANLQPQQMFLREQQEAIQRHALAQGQHAALTPEMVQQRQEQMQRELLGQLQQDRQPNLPSGGMF